MKYPETIYKIRYEDLKKNTLGELIKLRDKYKMEIPNEAVTQSVYNNDAENMRTGKIKKRGNLDEGGISRNWKIALTEKEGRKVLPIVNEALLELNYDAA
jgi:hypothetical protein